MFTHIANITPCYRFYSAALHSSIPSANGLIFALRCVRSFIETRAVIRRRRDHPAEQIAASYEILKILKYAEISKPQFGTRSLAGRSCDFIRDSFDFRHFRMSDSILPYYGHFGKGLNKTADYSCKTARFSICNLPSPFPVAPPKAARVVP